MPNDGSGIAFVDQIFNFSISSGLVIFLLLFVIFYLIFSIILVRQITIMARSVTTSLGPILKLLSLINLIASIGLLLMTLALF